MSQLSFTPFHWLDCNVFVEAKNGPFSFAVAPGFWTWLVRAAKEDRVRSPVAVYNELLEGKDQLANWARSQRSSGLFVTPDREVQKRYGEIAAFVQSRYQPPFSAAFLDGADPWVIAHALDDGGTVVTHETLVSSNSMRVKIPNVCAHFGVGCIRAYEAFEKLGLKLSS